MQVVGTKNARISSLRDGGLLFAGEKGQIESDNKLSYDTRTGRLDVPILGGLEVDGNIDLKGNLLQNAHLDGDYFYHYDWKGSWQVKIFRLLFLKI